MRVRLKYRRLGEELSKSHLSLNRWAQRLGLSSGHLSDLVNGKRLYPAPKTRDKLLEGLGLSFEILFEIESAQVRKEVAPVRMGSGSVAFHDASRDRPRSPVSKRGELDMFALIRDLRYGVRNLMRSPGFSLAALLTLAIGIAANTALFGIVDSILWKPYPYPDGDRLVVVHGTVERRGLTRSNVSFPDFVAVREQSDLLEGLAAWDWEPYNLAAGGEPQRVGGTRVSAGFFEVLGVPPLQGRTFAEEDDRPESAPVVILTEGLWHASFGADPEIIGSSVLINSRPTTVIGVMPRAAEYPDQTQLWVPLAFDEEMAPRGFNFLGTLGRLKHDVELASVATEVESIASRIQQDFPETNEGRGFGVVTLRHVLAGELKPLSVSLLGVVMFVLLIVCANVANLLLSRGVSRERDVAIRRAVGASGGRLAQALLCESTVLAFAGGLVGFCVGWLAVGQIVRLIDVEIPPWIQIQLDHRVVLYTVGVTAVAAGVFSLLPMLQALKHNAASSLGTVNWGGNQYSVSKRGRNFRAGLVISEVALSLVLLVGAGLMLQSVIVLASVEPGFEPRGALRVGLDLLAHGDKEPEVRAELFGRHLDRIEALPGVSAVGAISLFPLQGRSSSVGITAEGQGADAMADNPHPQFARVTPGYFTAMGIPMLRGETFSSMQETDGFEEAVVSERLARILWPGEEPVGRRLKLGALDSEGEWLTVRGVVGDIVHHGLDRERPPHLYLAYNRSAPTRMTVVVRTAGGDAAAFALAPAVRNAVHEVDPHQPLHDLATVGEIVSRSMWMWRFFGTLFWWFAGLALALTVVGIYGVMSYSVTQRRREVGLRIALGAGQGEVIGLVLRQGAILILAGLLVGLPLAVALGTMLSGALFDVRPVEPLTLTAVSAVLVLVSLTAVLLPARRAARVDPAASLRVG